jgi:hypothetical protein
MRQRKPTVAKRKELERALYLEGRLLYIDQFFSVRREVQRRIEARDRIEQRERRLRGIND